MARTLPGGRGSKWGNEGIGGSEVWEERANLYMFAPGAACLSGCDTRERFMTAISADGLGQERERLK